MVDVVSFRELRLKAKQFAYKLVILLGKKIISVESNIVACLYY